MRKQNVLLTLRVRLDGDWSIFRQEIVFGAKTSAENMDLSPFAVQGGQSHFRGENINSLVTSFPPRKSGQSPVNGCLQ